MTLSELKEIKDQELASRKKTTIRCCMAAGCASQGSDELLKNLQQAVGEAGLEDEIEVRGVGCMRLCCQGPLAQADPAENQYCRAKNKVVQSRKIRNFRK